MEFADIDTEFAHIAYHSEKLYQCRDVKIACDSFGDKSHPPILLIMGLSTQLIHWPEAFCRMLADKGFWVIRFDNRDMGKSTILKHLPPPGFHQLIAHRLFNRRIVTPYSLGEMAMDAISLLDVLKIAKVHVVGASMGGMIAQLMAITAPERTLSLTSIMSTTGEKRLMWPSLKVLRLMAKKHGKEQEDHIQQGLKLWETLHGNYLHFPREHYSQIIEHAYKRGFYTTGVLRQLAAISTTPDRTPALKKLNLPSLIIHGDADPMLKVKNAHALHRAMPHSQKLILKGMGHTLPQEYWGLMIDSIADMATKTRSSV